LLKLFFRDALSRREREPHCFSISLDDLRLLPGEAATRGAIASTEKKELWGQTGDGFRLALLLTQTQALSHARHLAKVAGEHESQPDRARAPAGVSEDMKNLYHEAFVMLLSKSKSKPPFSQPLHQFAVEER
jgi:hypothetical protein